MAEQNTGEEKRYYFRRRQFVFMAVGFTFAALIIYFLGILTGVKMAEESFVKSESSPTEVSPQPFVEKPAPSPKMLTDSELPKQDVILKPSPAQPSTKEPVQDERAGEKASKTEMKVAMSPAKEPPLAPAKTSPQSPSPKTAPQEVAEKTPVAPKAAKPKESDQTWTVQVKAFPDADSANVWVYALKAKGYDAYRIAVSVKGKTWHRVRAGRFVDRNEAEELRKILVAKEGLKDAFLTSVQKTEAADS